MSTRETVLVAVAATLGALAGGRVYRSRREQLPELPAIVIQPISEESSELVLTRADRRLRVGVSIYAAGETPDTAADAVLAAAWAALSAAPDLGLGSDIQLDQAHTVDWEIENFYTVRALLTVTVNYRTAAGAM